jgi:hypothetical protein
MDKCELIISTTKELLITVLDGKHGVNLNLKGGNDAIADLGEKFKTLAAKINEAADAITYPTDS